VAVARELPQAFGEAYQKLDRNKEVHILRSVVDFVKLQSEKDRGTFLNPELLRTQIQFAAHMYDQEEKLKKAGEKPVSWTSGDY
jgi:hypothetical protein